MIKFPYTNLKSWKILLFLYIILSYSNDFKVLNILIQIMQDLQMENIN